MSSITLFEHRQKIDNYLKEKERVINSYQKQIDDYQRIINTIQTMMLMNPETITPDEEGDQMSDAERLSILTSGKNQLEQTLKTLKADNDRRDLAEYRNKLEKISKKLRSNLILPEAWSAFNNNEKHQSVTKLSFEVISCWQKSFQIPS